MLRESEAQITTPATTVTGTPYRMKYIDVTLHIKYQEKKHLASSRLKIPEGEKNQRGRGFARRQFKDLHRRSKYDSKKNNIYYRERILKTKRNVRVEAKAEDKRAIMHRATIDRDAQRRPSRAICDSTMQRALKYTKIPNYAMGSYGESNGRR